jgi:glycosyltransferase involved in cell wall biosynthesis
LTDVEIPAEPLVAGTEPLVAGTGSPGALHLAAAADAALESGLRRVELVAWRDLDDPEAGGSELHAHHVAARWASAGLDVVVRTSAVRGAPETVVRDGYRVVRRGGRYAVFPRTALSHRARRGAPDGLVEIWNGMPFFSPLWSAATRLVFLHHVHAEMWRMVLPSALARFGELVERRLAPPLYRGTRVVTLSDSSRHEIRTTLGLPRVDVVPPGVDTSFTPGPGRDRRPTVLVVGRLVPVKRLPLLMDVLARVRHEVPQLQVVVVGEGYGRPALEAAVDRAGGRDWVELAGRCGPTELLAHYRRAWVLASASQREGWGMTITEAAACGTPAVVTRIPGHLDAVVPGVSGLLAPGPGDLASSLTAVLTDRVLRQRLSRGAIARAAQLSWEATAAGTLEILVDEHRRRLDAVGSVGPVGRDPRRRRGPAQAM